MNNRPGSACAEGSAARGTGCAARGGATLGRRSRATVGTGTPLARGGGKIAHAGEPRLRRGVEGALDGPGDLRLDPRPRLGETGLHQGRKRILVRLGPAPALGDLLGRAVLVAPRLPAVPGECAVP